MSARTMPATGGVWVWVWEGEEGWRWWAGLLAAERVGVVAMEGGPPLVEMGGWEGEGEGGVREMSCRVALMLPSSSLMPRAGGGGGEEGEGKVEVSWDMEIYMHQGCRLYS